jgi:hypothetical protein
MIKTLRITSIVAAVLAAIFLISLVLFGTRSNKQVEQFIKSEGVVERFNKSESSKEKRSSQTSPLVTQAKEFAEYLNPPPAIQPPGPPVVQKPSVQPPRPSVSSAKFTLVGTSYYALQPERSLAFINEPGKGMRWVRQSSEVGHLIVEQVKDGLVVVRDGQRTFELSMPESPQRSLIEGAMPVLSAVVDQAAPESTDTISSSASPGAEEISQMEEFLKSIQETAESNDVESKEMEKIMSDLESMRISASEAKRLKNLPGELTDAQQSTGRLTADPNQPKSRKVETPARSRRPTRPRVR